ncbi:MAG: methylenetetrahydrofolate reductase C-terminal domain-containing protein [Deltaproteobacteria bacterium]|nr:methylenetetrahydrofolate reductase C-terminal domain-containing protein [Deltaproteobacteria bacterium]MBW2076404.1 methylenetetrahydrofolate reductase C-terminal domain-containing protein [Deltaproteobacteria bacterium]MBW2310656.1 methylenetetrahydrofolate reductase C-terminal domain-containing protein [Deltaproteobacteria bacterium]
MIVGERKPFSEILSMVEGDSKILILGCGSCVTVCMAGGEEEVKILGSQLRMAFRRNGNNAEVTELVALRQCDDEYLEDAPLIEKVKDADIVISMACGVGVQHASTFFNRVIDDKTIRVVPALNTTFMGANIDVGEWHERCLGCGDCVLEKTGGICPITRCAKSLLNGPCGGSFNGKCEVNKDTDCAWHLIIERLEALGELDNLKKIEMYKDWRPSHSGGPRKTVREDMKI